jgi:hypothetical protein
VTLLAKLGFHVEYSRSGSLNAVSERPTKQ